MAYNITITYDATKDILNAKKEVEGVVTPVAIPGLENRNAPSDAYIYAPAGSTAPVYNAENLVTTNYTAPGPGTATTTDTYKTASLLTSSQRRWPKAVTNSIKNILAAYLIPQVPVYRAWQTIKLAVTSGTYTFSVPTFAESSFYVEAGKALNDYGITIASVEATE